MTFLNHWKNKLQICVAAGPLQIGLGNQREGLEVVSKLWKFCQTKAAVLQRIRIVVGSTPTTANLPRMFCWGGGAVKVVCPRPPRSLAGTTRYGNTVRFFAPKDRNPQSKNCQVHLFAQKQYISADAAKSLWPSLCSRKEAGRGNKCELFAREMIGKTQLHWRPLAL